MGAGINPGMGEKTDLGAVEVVSVLEAVAAVDTWAGFSSCFTTLPAVFGATFS